MEILFLKIFNMGIAVGWVILAVLFLRFFLRKAPRAVCCILWALVAVRLVWPISLESAFSLIPSTETLPQEILTAQEPAIETGINGLDSRVNRIITDSLVQDEKSSVNPMQGIIRVAAHLWAAGAVTMLMYAAVTWIRLRRRVAVSLRMEENIWICDAVKSPFILGFLHSRIYLPSDLTERERACVIAHEKAHLGRHDHWWKPFGFLLLSVYWFQPLCWLAYILLCRDIELSCDERVIREMGDEEKKIYAEALLACSVPRHIVSACPVAFGEVGVKKRVKSVLNYRKPAFWIIGMAVAVCAAAALCLLTNPVSANLKLSGVDMNELGAKIQTMDKKTAYVFAVYESDRMPGKLLAGFTDSDDRIGYAVFEQEIIKGEIRYHLMGHRLLGEEPLENDTLGTFWGFDKSVTVVLARNQNLAYVTAQAEGEVQEARIVGKTTGSSMLVLEWPRLLAEEADVHYYDRHGEELANPQSEAWWRGEKKMGSLELEWVEDDEELGVAKPEMRLSDVEPEMRLSNGEPEMQWSEEEPEAQRSEEEPKMQWSDGEPEAQWTDEEPKMQ